MFTTICVVSILNRHPCLLQLISFNSFQVYDHVFSSYTSSWLDPPFSLSFRLTISSFHLPPYFSFFRVVIFSWSLFKSFPSCNVHFQLFFLYFFNLPFSFPPQLHVVIDWFYNIGVAVPVPSCLSFNPVSQYSI